MVKALHIVFMVTWFAGLFYLPRLFVYHAQATDAIGIERFKIMERKLYFGIMTPGAVLTIVVRHLAVAGVRHLRRLAACQAGIGGDSHRAITSTAGSCWPISSASAIATATSGTDGSTSFPVLILAGVVILVVVKPF